MRNRFDSLLKFGFHFFFLVKKSICFTKNKERKAKIHKTSPIHYRFFLVSIHIHFVHHNHCSMIIHWLWWNNSVGIFYDLIDCNKNREDFCFIALYSIRIIFQLPIRIENNFQMRVKTIERFRMLMVVWTNLTKYKQFYEARQIYFNRISFVAIFYSSVLKRIF